MSTLRTILAATDLSPDAHRAALRAALLAREHAATLRILHVTRPASAGIGQGLGRVPLDLEGRASDETGRALQSLIEEVKTPDLVVETEVRAGAVLDEAALQAVVSDDARLLAATDARSPLDHALSGGEDFELLMAIQCEPSARTSGLHFVGRVASAGFSLRRSDGTLVALEPKGWVH